MQKLLKNKNYIIIFVVVVLALIPSIYFYTQYQKSQEMLKNPTSVTKQEVKDLLDRIGKIFELPKGEQPTLATVSDKSKLADQPFFKNAENGDKVIIYSQAKKAILYRPSENKIIDIAFLNLGNTPVQPGQPVPSGAQSPISAKIVILNGTTKTGLTSVAEKQIVAKMTNIEVTDKSNASSSAYTTSLVVYASPAQKQNAENIASIIKAKTGLLPAGEKMPVADILIILGKDFVQ